MKPISLVAVLATAAWAKTISVDVGASGLAYSPDTIIAAVGDTVEFTFHAIAHSITQSSFSSPCQPLAGGINSGLVPVAAGQSSAQVFKVKITDTNPIWFFCMQVQHCQLGMAGVINPPSSGNSLVAYRSAASSATTGQDSAVSGGTFGAPGGNEQASSAPAASSAATVASTSAAAAASSSVAAAPTTTAAPTKAASSTTAAVATTTVVAVVATANATVTIAGNATLSTTGAPIAATNAVAKQVVGWGVLAVGVLAGLAL